MNNEETLLYVLNEICFTSEHTAEVEIGLRFLRKYGYIDFDEEKKLYINKHYSDDNISDDDYKENEEKAFFIKDDELDDYTKQLEKKVDLLISNAKSQKETNDVLIKKISKLEREVKIKNQWCQLIIDIGFDYDGYSKADSLKKIIDEIVGYSKKAIENDENCVMYENAEGEKLNILEEVINENNNLI